jgi:hypothetical protein
MTVDNRVGGRMIACEYCGAKRAYSSPFPPANSTFTGIREQGTDVNRFRAITACNILVFRYKMTVTLSQLFIATSGCKDTEGR